MSTSPYEAQRTIEERWEEYLKDHPDVYPLLMRFTIEASKAGFRHYGIATIFERVRWHIDTKGKDSRGFKINNDFRSRAARMLNEDPIIVRHCGKDFFETRELKAL